MDESLPSVFRELVDQITSKGLNRTPDWELSEKNGNAVLLIPKANPDGFDVTVIADKNEVSVYTEYLAHRHFTSDGNHRETASLAMGLVRDLLAPNMRVHVFEVGGSPYKAILEVFHKDSWQDDGSTGLLVIPWFRKKTERFYTNQRLPAREPFSN